MIATVVFLIGRLLVGVICAAVASRKNRSAFGWFCLGLLFGLTALLIIACLEPYRDQPRVINIVQAK